MPPYSQSHYFFFLQIKQQPERVALWINEIPGKTSVPQIFVAFGRGLASQGERLGNTSVIKRELENSRESFASKMFFHRPRAKLDPFSSQVCNILFFFLFFVINYFVLFFIINFS